MQSVYIELVVVRVNGYEPTAPVSAGTGQDGSPGEPVWLCETYGYEEVENSGIIWMDDDVSDRPLEFKVLIDQLDLEDFKDFALEHKYQVLDVTPVTEPMAFGEAGDSVEICKHRAGWIVMED